MRIGVDIGGTFTDFVVCDEETGAFHSFKLLSTPEAPERAVMQGLERLDLREGTLVIHGSTVATNALLERKGARTALIATEGFRDFMTIGRQNRETLYDLNAGRPEPLVPPEGCFEVRERLDYLGEVIVPLDETQLAAMARRLKAYRAESVAVCLLFSFLRSDHERRVAEALKSLGIPISLSCEVLPEYREVERGSTTVINAYVAPILDRYLGRLADGLPQIHLRVMGSNGGTLGASEARRQAARSVLSGPAGGVVGAVHLSRLAGYERVITLDMGGTSTDVSLAIEEPTVTNEWAIDGLPLRLPVIDIHTIGAGGGSIARTDPAGALRVGPQSAGADPGPCCYGRGGSLPTVTDANLVLRRLDAERFLGGDMRLDHASAVAALDRLARDLQVEGEGGLTRAQAAAMGVIRVVNAHMTRALRVISVARGHDPRDFLLTCFGGAGGLHASALARELGIGRVLVPSLASTLSAFGMLTAEVVKDYVSTVMLSGDTSCDDLLSRMEQMETQARADLRGEGVAKAQMRFTPRLDLRYRGQSYELSVDLQQDFLQSFHEEHERMYGHSDPGAPVEIVNLRMRGIGEVQPPDLRPMDEGDHRADRALIDEKDVVFIARSGGRPTIAPLYDGERLLPGDVVQGPAVLALPDTTILVEPGDLCQVDAFRNLLIDVRLNASL